jgi:hypothetical protein
MSTKAVRHLLQSAYQEVTMATCRRFFGFLATATVAVTSWAQIPNAGFEAWTLTEPDGWSTSNAAPVYTNVTKSATAHTGLAALKGEAVQLYTIVAGAAIQSGPGGHGFAYAQRPAAVTGWYQFNSVGDDRFGVNVILYKGGETGTPVAHAASADPTTRSSYTQFNVPFIYYNSDIPDLCIAQFSVALANGITTVHVGSYFLLDDLAFAGAAGVDVSPESPVSFKLRQNFPNPFNPSTTIGYGLPNRSRVTLTVINTLGEQVAQLVDGELDAGNHEVRFDASGLSSGVYFYRIQAGNFVATRRLLLLR